MSGSCQGMFLADLMCLPLVRVPSSKVTSSGTAMHIYMFVCINACKYIVVVVVPHPLALGHVSPYATLAGITVISYFNIAALYALRVFGSSLHALVFRLWVFGSAFGSRFGFCCCASRGGRSSCAVMNWGAPLVHVALLVDRWW